MSVKGRSWPSLTAGEREHGAARALVGGAHGTEIIQWLLADVRPHLAAGGVLAAEMGASQATRLIEVAREAFPDAELSVMKDLAGLDRVLIVRVGG